MPDVAVHEYVVEMLHDLKKQEKKIAIVSTSVKEFILPALQKHNAAEYIDHIIDGRDVVNHKPHPESLYKALEVLQGQKEQAIMIGDSAKDIKAGKNAGITTAVYYPDANHVLYTQDFINNLEADFVITDFRELPQIL